MKRLRENKQRSVRLLQMSNLSTGRRRQSVQHQTQKGFNSDVVYRGMNFHVQSEDWGADNPYLVSRVYQNGAVIKSVKTSYAEVLGPSASFLRSTRPQIDPNTIRYALREQHEKILDLLLSGQLF